MSLLPIYVLPLLLTASPSTPASKTPFHPAKFAILEKEGRAFLDGMLKDFLFDPSGAVRVRVLTPAKVEFEYHMPAKLRFDSQISAEATREDGMTPREGWFVKGRKWCPGRVYFADGEWIWAPKNMLRLDFVRECASEYDGEPGFDPPGDGAVFDAVNAAWLHRLGYDGLAALALKRARERGGGDKLRKHVRTTLASQACADLVGSFCTSEDYFALQHAERLNRLYPDLVEELAPNAPEIVADLKRREKQGTLGRKTASDKPAGYASWPVSRKVEYLVGLLDDDDLSRLDTWQATIRNGLVNFRPSGNVSNVRATHAIPSLLEIGEAAVPELIRAFEHDKRLTRCTEIDARSFQRTKRITPVYLAARSILMRILRTDCLDPQNLDPPGENSHAVQVAQFQRYWTTYGNLPFNERMMKILTDPACSIHSGREAAHNLAVENRKLIADCFDRSWNRTESQRAEASQRMTSLLKKYNSPTIAESIVAAMDAAVRKNAEANDNYPHAIGAYVDSLVRLGDARIVGELAKRAAVAGTIWQRVCFASACEKLGAFGPMIKIARELADGTITWTKLAEPSDRPDEEAATRLSELLEGLAQSKLPEVAAALDALADPAHPFHSRTLQTIVTARLEPQIPFQSWHQYPFALVIFRHALKDQRLTGIDYYLRGDDIEFQVGGKPVLCPTSKFPGSAGKWSEHAAERLCDRIADVISTSLIGAPEFHPLRKDRDEIIDRMDSLLRRYSGNLRPLREEESSRLLKESGWWMVCIPHIQPLGRPATPADVKAGRAVFELSGKGAVADVKLPTWVLLQTEAMKDHPLYGLVVQAEKGPDGKLVYGVIFRHEIRMVKEDEVVRIQRCEKE